MSEPHDVAQRTNAYLRELILGALDPNDQRKGWRRMRPLASNDDPGTVHARVDQCPMPDLHGERLSVELDDGGIEQAVLADIIPLESALARVEGQTVMLDFVFCDSYPVHLVPGVPNIDPSVTRVRTLREDSRRELWMSMCLEMLYNLLGDDALKVDFDVEWISGDYEELQALELTLPES